jgi:hypothetical protein
MRMLRLFSLLSALLAAALLTGCAHPVSLATDATRLVGTRSGEKIPHKVGLLITDEDRKLEVTTPGGGGDKVSYLPYRDLETGLYTALAEAFADVSRVASRTDPKIAAEGLRYVVTPRLRTTSHSPSLVTWPPTVFGIEITCRVTDPAGALVAEVGAIGEGRAEFDEFRHDFSLAPKRAAEDVLKKLVKAFAEQVAKLR